MSFPKLPGSKNLDINSHTYMPRNIIYLSILFFGFHFLKSQTDNSLLWKISGKGLKQPSYIYGTIHSVCPDDLYITKKVESSFAKCEKLVMEIDIDDPEMASKLQKLSYNKDQQNIKSQFSDSEELETVNSFFIDKYGAGLDQLGILKPFALLSMILQKSLDCNTPQSYERTFESMAGKQGIEILGLETIEEQVGLFDDVPVSDQIDWLVYYTSNEENILADMEKMVDLYKQEDLNALASLMASYPEYKQIEYRLLNERNQKWIPKIEKYAQENATFFAVGAGHLPGEEGVLNLLRNAGYKVEAVR
jgi:hypothetical protein